MPEATVHEDDLTMAGEDQVWLARQILPMQPETKPEPMSRAAHHEFRLGVAGTNTAHIGAAAFWAEEVGHSTYIARSSGRSAMSRSRLPDTMVSTNSRDESSTPDCSKLLRSSGNAK